MLALTETKLKGNGEVSWRGVNGIIAGVPRAIRESWQARWDTSRVAGNKLALIKHTVERWSSPTLRARHSEVGLTRLRIGHTWASHDTL